MSPSGSSTQISGTDLNASCFCRLASRSNALGSNTEGVAEFLLSRIGGIAILHNRKSWRTTDMSAVDREAHWQNVYSTKGEKEVSWFQEMPSKSLELIARCGAGPDSAIIEVGGGASRLVDELLKAGYRNVTILDLSEAALATSRERIGSRSEEVKWISGDATTWQPSGQYDIWHDRAAFHFLTEAQDRQDYVGRLKSALRHGGKVIIGT